MKFFAMVVTVLLAVPVLADDKGVPPTRVRELEITPVVGRKASSLYHPEKSAKVPSIMHVWATWCAPCRSELPDYLEFSKRKEFSKGSGYVAMSAVAWVDEMDSIVRYLTLIPCNVQKRTAGHRVFMVLKEDDLAGPDAKYWDIGVFPTTFFINADGTIALRVEGTIDWKSRKTRNNVVKFVQGKPFEIKEVE